MINFTDSHTHIIILPMKTLFCRDNNATRWKEKKTFQKCKSSGRHKLNGERLAWVIGWLLSFNIEIIRLTFYKVEYFKLSVVTYFARNCLKGCLFKVMNEENADSVIKKCNFLFKFYFSFAPQSLLLSVYQRSVSLREKTTLRTRLALQSRCLGEVF